SGASPARNQSLSFHYHRSTYVQRSENRSSPGGRRNSSLVETDPLSAVGDVVNSVGLESTASKNPTIARAEVMTEPSPSPDTSRRSFWRPTGQVTAASALAGVAVPAVHAAEDNTIRVALVGCGGRGTGAAANALSTRSGPIKLVAMADVFKEKLDR